MCLPNTRKSTSLKLNSTSIKFYVESRPCNFGDLNFLAASAALPPFLVIFLFKEMYVYPYCSLIWTVIVS